LFAALGEIDERYLHEEPAKKSRRFAPVKLAAVAACVVLMTVAGATMWMHHDSTPPVSVTEPTSAATEPTRKHDYIHPTIRDGDRVLYTAAAGGSDCYAAPGPGEIIWDVVGGNRFLDNLRDTDLVWLGISPNVPSQGVMGKADREAEAMRLAKLGIEVYTKDLQWTGYWGEDVHQISIAAVMTVEQARNFPVREDYAYMFGPVYAEKSEYTRVIPE